jgi:hypothetical protein
LKRRYIFLDATKRDRQYRRNGRECGLELNKLSEVVDGPERDRNTQYAIDFCLARPKWRLSLQTHKMTGIR